jgi:hypothetical protein
VRRAASVLAALAALAAAGCGGSTSPKPPPALTGAQAQGLLTRLETVRAAATAGDPALTQRRLRGFVREVGRLRRAGALDAATERALLRGAAQAQAHAAVEVVPPPPPPEPKPEPGKGKGKHDEKLPPGQAKKQGDGGGD